MEMRFYIPSNELAGDKDPVEAFQQQVMKKASVISVSGDAIAIFREIQCLTPRFVSPFLHFSPSKINFRIFLVVVMILKFSKLSFNCTVKRSTIKYQCLRFCDCLFYRIRIHGRCFSLLVWIRR